MIGGGGEWFLLVEAVLGLGAEVSEDEECGIGERGLMQVFVF